MSRKTMPDSINTNNDMNNARELGGHEERIGTLEERSDRFEKQITELLVQSTKTALIVANLVKIGYIVLTAVVVSSITVIVRDYFFKSH